MRRTRYSQTFVSQSNQLLAQGLSIFGPDVVAEKRDIVYRTIETFLVEHPGVRQAEPKIGLRFYSVLRTPFVIVYDFDDDELRLHFVFHRRASLEDLDPAAAEW